MKDPQAAIDRIRNVIETKTRFVLTTHVHPDGDGIGCELALYHHLKGLGKDVHILNPSPLPDLYRFLDPEGARIQEYGERHARTLGEAEALFLLDLSSVDRLGPMGSALAKNGPLRICIDHHPGPGPSCDLAWIDDRAASVGELVFVLLKRSGCGISREIAEALYVAILTDTGGFRYSNVTAQTHRVVAELLGTGFDHHDIYRRVYESTTWRQYLLFARAIGGLERACSDKVAWMCLTREMFEETGTEEKDTEGLAEFPRGIAGVQIAILFIERGPDCIRVRFRSRRETPVDGLARELGGGGHKNASAAVLEGTPLRAAVDRVVALAGKYVRQGSGIGDQGSGTAPNPFQEPSSKGNLDDAF
jgi:phosphoesterase RecJ-like protein